MITMETWNKVREYRLIRKYSIKKIARKLNISKNTVKKYLKSNEPPIFKPREYSSKLDNFKNEIEEMLRKDFIGTRIYSELKLLGFDGSLSSVHKYISKYKKEKKLNKKITTRFETSPGEQMQYDWKVWHLPVNGKCCKIYIHELILSYSRKKFYTFSLTITTTDVIRAIYEGIKYFGGFAQELLIDNGKQMVILHKQNGVIRYNDEFLKFCTMLGILPNACENYRARTKGKVERSFYYLQEHFLKGLKVTSFQKFEDLLSEFLVKHNNKELSNLKESPEQRFHIEQANLYPMPVVEPSSILKKELRQVSYDGYISCFGCFYPVPMQYCNQNILIESVYGRKLNIYNLSGELIKSLNRGFDKGIKPGHPEHKDLNSVYWEKKQSKRSQIIKKFIETFGDEGQIFLKNIKQKDCFNLAWHLSEILELVMLYQIEDIQKSLQTCNEIGCFHKNSVKNLLKPSDNKIPIIKKSELLNFAKFRNIKRSLSDYRIEVKND